jgi:hypothetical protein
MGFNLAFKGLSSAFIPHCLLQSRMKIFSYAYRKKFKISHFKTTADFTMMYQKVAPKYQYRLEVYCMNVSQQDTFLW